jgi:hypothetical protein
VAGPLGTPPLLNPVLYTVDTTTNQLIRLTVNSVTDTASQATVDTTFTPVALPVSSGARPSVGLAQNGTEEVVLVGIGTTVYAYDAATGAAVGNFVVSQLGSVDGIGSSALGTMFTQNGGIGLSVNVQASLASGSAVGAPIFPQREFVFNGGVTGVAGIDALYVDGAAHFDTAQPNLFQFGTALYSLIGVELSRTAIPGFFSPFINAGPTGLLPSPFDGTGSLDTRLARLLPPNPVLGTGTSIRLVNPTNETTVKTIPVATTDTLAGLSESYHPELAGTSGNAAQTGAAIININGDARRVLSQDTTGLIYNVSGAVNLVGVHKAVDSTFIGYPLNHIEVPIRQNSQFLSNQRGFNGRVTRNGISVVPGRPPIGPLALPVMPPTT